MTQTSMQLHLAEHMLLIHAPTVITGPTRRPVYVFIWSTTNRVFTLFDTNGKVLFKGKAVLVAPNVIRQLKTVDSHIFSLNIEPGHPHFLPLSFLNFKRGLFPLDTQQLLSFSNNFYTSLKTADYTTIETNAYELISSILPYKILKNNRDKRIELLLPLLDTNTSLELTSLAKMTNLSKDRLSHLFTEEIGMPIRSYILWRRYRRAMLAIQSGEKISTIAHHVGFYDQAQMSRTFLSLFGYSPSFLKHPNVLQISSEMPSSKKLTQQY